MPIPYLITTLLYVFVTLLVVADVSLISFKLASAFAALRWMRVHFITLGISSQLIFGLLPGLVASHAKKPRPPMRWDTWLALNVGLVLLVAGFAGVVQPLILAGGTLIFTAAILLVGQLWKARSAETPTSLKFYITGVLYLLIGIIIGTGLWLNWSQALYIKKPLETHIHANLWGFMSLVLAGLLVDLITMLTGHAPTSSRATSIVYASMTLGAFGLVLGPWLGINIPFYPLGLVLLLGGTGYLLVLVIRALKASGHLASAGAWHIISSYLWIFGPMLAAPLVPLGYVQAGPIEFTAPQTLVYAWVLQFSIALIPYVARRYFLKEEHPKLGGSWISLAAMTIGNSFVWASTLIEPARDTLYGIGFAFYAIALLPPLKELVQIMQAGMKRFETD